MTRARFRLPDGGRIDRERPVSFSFDGERYGGCAGDTLASALLANGVRLVGRSFKYHRPRGVVTDGVEEPNALVQLGVGAAGEPNARATQVEIHDGLTAASQNCWPNVRFDAGAVNGLLSALFPAGFYYKTFMWPGKWWMKYEYFIRQAAGLGRAPTGPDPDTYDKSYAHCDVLVVGAGPSGLAAAHAAGRTGARVLVVDERSEPGGHLPGTRQQIDDAPADEWVDAMVSDLAEMEEVRILSRATALGYYDHNYLTVLERRTDHLPYRERGGRVRQRLWKVRARQVVLATGAHERPLVFRNNDRPGVMLASAAQSYVNRYAVAARVQRGGVHQQRHRLRPGARSGRCRSARDAGGRAHRAFGCSPRSTATPGHRAAGGAGGHRRAWIEGGDRRLGRHPDRRRDRIRGWRPEDPLRSRVHVRWLESGDPPLLPVGRPARLRRGQGGVRPGRGAPGAVLGRRLQRDRSARVRPVRGARGRQVGGGRMRVPDARRHPAAEGGRRRGDADRAALDGSATPSPTAGSTSTSSTSRTTSPRPTSRWRRARATARSST